MTKMTEVLTITHVPAELLSIIAEFLTLPEIYNLMRTCKIFMNNRHLKDRFEIVRVIRTLIPTLQPFLDYWNPINELKAHYRSIPDDLNLHNINVECVRLHIIHVDQIETPEEKELIHCNKVINKFVDENPHDMYGQPWTRWLAYDEDVDNSPCVMRLAHCIVQTAKFFPLRLATDDDRDQINDEVSMRYIDYEDSDESDGDYFDEIDEVGEVEEVEEFDYDAFNAGLNEGFSDDEFDGYGGYE
jgi:hypothetical protein